MASKRRIRRKMCDGKKQLSKLAAIIVRKKLIKKGSINLSYYKCRFCKQYHIGHNTKKMKQEMKKRKENK